MLRTMIALATVVSAAATKHDGLRDDAALMRPPPPPPPPVNPALVALEKQFNATRAAACAMVIPHVPTVDTTAFMTAYQGFSCASYNKNCTGSEDAVQAAAAKVIADPKLQAFLSLPDSFSAADGLDAAMVKCAVMTEAVRGDGGTSHGRGAGHTDLLAVFAVQGAAEAALVDKLLADTILMKDMLVAGGPANGHYGEAMSIYSKLLAGSSALRESVAAAPADAALWDDREPANVLKRLAVGTAVALAVPLEHRFGGGDFPNGGCSRHHT